MIKAAFITIHVGNNFGSILQTIATDIILRNHGIKPILVNYVPNRVTTCNYWKCAVKSPFSFIRRLLFFPIFYYNKYIFQRYLKENCNVSKPIYKRDSLSEKCPKADIYITGSDQVWNSSHNEGFDAKYLFDNIKGNKISFSSSIGQENLAESDFDSLKTHLNDYMMISVRESSAKSIINKMGYEAELIIDPTLVISKEKWRNFIEKRLVKQPYLLLYIPYNIKDLNEILIYARQVAKAKSLIIVTFSWDIFNKKYADKTFKFADPGDFLSLMYYADFIITNSFHGTAFSINFNKQFRVFLPSGFSTRLISILDLCNIKDIVLVNSNKHNTYSNNQIDYSKVNLILDSEREKANIFLDKAIKQCI